MGDQSSEMECLRADLARVTAERDATRAELMRQIAERDEVRARGRALRREVEALKVERDALCAIVDGREGTPMWRQEHPTQTEAMAHAVSGGLWLGMKPGEMPFVVGFHDDESVGGLALFSDRFPYNDPMDMEWDEVWMPDNFGGCVWCPIRSDGRPCAWPVVEADRG